LLRRTSDQLSSRIGDAEREAAARSYALPEPRVAEGRWLAASRNVHAMMDCSDGLSIDVDRLSRASGCGALLSGVPVAPSAAAIAIAAGDEPLRYALEGGEDFELIVAVAPRAFSYLAGRFEKRFKQQLIAVGRLDPKPGLRLQDGTAEPRALTAAGWDHLAR
jgi:thiamine-monophosphate kinase